MQRIGTHGIRVPAVSPRTVALTAAALVGFAANSLLCRLSLAQQAIDPVSFTGVRLLSGGTTLLLLVVLTGAPARVRRSGSWVSAASLFSYAIAFSLAYVRLGAGVGALLLFGAVQMTMLGWGLARGERLHLGQWLGLALAIAGLTSLALRGAHTPEPWAAGLMLIAGAAWGVYTLRGRGATHPLAVTADNFARAVPAALLLAIVFWSTGGVHLTPWGVALAVVSGGLASGVGYSLWYAALPGMSASQAAVVQLLVPVLAAAGGIVLLDEKLTVRLVLGGASILVGVALALRKTSTIVARRTAPVRLSGT